MRKANNLVLFFLAVFSSLLFTSVGTAEPFLAFSMNEAHRLIKASSINRIEVLEMAGITKPIGIVYDEDLDDLIVIGEVTNTDERLTLDDFVVALRAILKHGVPPLVSIDDPDSTGEQVVRFEGGIANTTFGSDLLEADVVLKKLGLGKLSAEIWGVQSYFEMSSEHWRLTGQESPVTSRFWFKPSRQKSFVGVRPGVAVVERLKVTVTTEVKAAPDSTVRQGRTSLRDEIGEHFAAALAANFEDTCTSFQEMGRLDQLFRLTGLAEGVRRWHERFGLDVKSLDFWLHDYHVEARPTKTHYPVLASEAKLTRNGKTHTMNITGGIDLEALVLDLKDRSIVAFKDAVILCRPKGRQLFWEVPIGPFWESPTDEEVGDEVIRELEEAVSDHHHGMCLRKGFSTPGPGPSFESQIQSLTQVGSRSLLNSMHSFRYGGSLPSRSYSERIGGVMLDGVAKVGSGGKVQVDLTSGNFSLIVDGKGARIAPEAFRKFVTALWSVYYSNQDPGISIDPIAPGVDKHMVRYIGKVINTDLGRVMREADYLMKKWSVGTERPDMRGFRNPDEISGRRGYVYLAASRFWFIPEDMRFKQTNNMLLFDDGRMTVKTEYLLAEQLKTRADPANEQFAQFLTDNYNQLGQKYPVFQELFDYAKMVSLAKYLKQSGVPLFWFLMANKDLVLTEDSPGTVEALAKGSDYFKNLRIEGGVDLGAQGHYVYDSQATEAIREAVSKYGTASQSTTTSSYKVRELLPVGRSFSFDLGGQSYSVAPQHSLTSGKDRRGIRYQTDIALRARGFKLTERSWDALEHDATYREFARQWNHHVDTLSKSELEREGQKLYKQTWKEAEKKVAIDLKQLKSLVGKKYESEDAFTKAVKRALGPSSDGHLKALAKKHAYYQTDLEVVRFFNPKGKTQGQFGQGWHLLIPYRIKPSGTAKRDFLNARIPEKMAVENLISGKQEVLTFSTQRYTAAGYVPEKIESSQVVGLFIRTDASYRLVDKLGNEFCFDKAGYLTEMSLSRNHHIKVEYLDSFEDVFEKTPYQIQPAGKEYVQVLNTSVPKVMVARDLLNGSSEEFIFAKEIAAYIPKNGVQSRFEVLNMMTDASFQLHDKLGNVIAFGPDGWFASFAVSPDARMVKSVSAGPYKVDFNYRVGSFGQVHIASAELSEEGKAKPLYAVHYEYDNEGRLCKAESSGAKVAKSHRLAENSVIVAKR